MEHPGALASNLTTMDSNNNNNNPHRHQQRRKKIAKQQQLVSLSKKPQLISMYTTDRSTNQENISLNEQQQQQRYIPMKNSLSWKQRWSKWFSSCGSERTMHIKSNPITISIEKRTRTKSEMTCPNEAVPIKTKMLPPTRLTREIRQKNLPTTHSAFAISPLANENPERNLSRTSSHQHRHHHQSIDKVNNSNTALYRDTSRRYSNTFFSSVRCGGAGGGGGGQQQQQHQSRTSIAGIPLINKTSQVNHQKQQAQHLSRSADRLNSKSTRRELRYEEHDDYIPPPLPLNSIQCHPTIDHYARALNQSSYFHSTHRRSQIEVYQLSSTNNRVILPRPYSSNFPLSQNKPSTIIPVTYSSTVDNFRRMSQTSLDNNTYGKLSDCRSPVIPVGNSSVKTPRRIESAYSQFPTNQQEPIYANTQSLYDNILYPETTTTTKLLNRNEKKSCASQTQLTWTMATFSSFVDLENQSIIIQQPDPTTLYSVVRHQHIEPPPSASPATIEHMKRMSPNLQYIDNTASPSYNQRPHTPGSSKMVMIEKRDGSFQTLLTIAPTEDIDSNRTMMMHHDSTPSPLSTGSSSTTDPYQHHHHHHHHRHRRHKSRSSSSRNNISTRDVGLQVSIQTVKKITFSSERSDDSSLTTSTSSPPTVITSREVKNVQTNTEPLTSKQDQSTSYEKTFQMITSSSQTLDSPVSSHRITKAAQTSAKSLRDQSTETNHQGLFVCDLSSFLKNGVDETPSTLSSTTTKRKF